MHVAVRRCIGAGQPAKRFSKLRFSCTMMTMCLMYLPGDDAAYAVVKAFAGGSEDAILPLHAVHMPAVIATAHAVCQFAHMNLRRADDQSVCDPDACSDPPHQLRSSRAVDEHGGVWGRI